MSIVEKGWLRLRALNKLRQDIYNIECLYKIKIFGIESKKNKAINKCNKMFQKELIRIGKL